jgi:hypothetical protein
MKMNDLCASGSLMQIVDVLGDDGDFEDVFKFPESFVRGVWLNGLHAFSTFVVEPQDPSWITFPSIGSRYKRNGLTLP